VEALIVGSVLWFGRSDERVVTVDSTPTTVPAVETTINSVVETVPPSSTTPATAPAAYAIGDSVMLGAADLLMAQGVVVDAKENRGVEGTLEVIRALTAAGSPWAGSALVVQVGTNSAISGADLELVLSNVPAETLVLFMTVHAPVEWAAANNEVLRNFATPATSRAKLIDWDAAAVDEELCPDGIHISCDPRASARYVGLVMSSLAQARAESTLLEIPAEPVKRYVVRLADGDWLGAAQLLAEGGLEPEARADLRPLFDPEFGLMPGSVTTETLATALERWCAQALCLSPVDLQVVDGFNRAAVTYDLGGVRRTSTFVGGSFEGRPMVEGLPLQLPADADLAATVECPTDAVMRTSWADVDGDGWWEQIVVQSFDVEGSELGGGRNVVTVCGTDVKVQPLELIDGEGIWVYAVNPDRDGPDDLLIGSVPPFPAGSIYQYVDVDGVLADTGATFGFIGLTGTPGDSMGCEDLDDNGFQELVRYRYEFIGGTDVTNSSALQYDVSRVYGEPSPTRVTIELPNDPGSTAHAEQVVAGYCHGLPIRTN
jgi:hypothetical protein